jgi:hypothetical protein
VDLSSGKDKTLLIAAGFRCKRRNWSRVESELSACAASNIDIAQRRLRCPKVEAVAANALDCAIPDDALVLFSTVRFISSTFRSAIERIIESYDRCPRSLRIVYGHPWEHDWLLSTGRVVLENARRDSGRRNLDGGVRSMR